MTAVNLEAQIRQGLLRAVSSGVQYFQCDILFRVGERRPEAIERFEHRALAGRAEPLQEDVPVTQDMAFRDGGNEFGGRLSRFRPRTSTKCST